MEVGWVIRQGEKNRYLFVTKYYFAWRNITGYSIFQVAHKIENICDRLMLIGTMERKIGERIEAKLKPLKVVRGDCRCRGCRGSASLPREQRTGKRPWGLGIAPIHFSYTTTPTRDAVRIDVSLKEEWYSEFSRRSGRALKTTVSTGPLSNGVVTVSTQDSNRTPEQVTPLPLIIPEILCKCAGSPPFLFLTSSLLEPLQTLHKQILPVLVSP